MQCMTNCRFINQIIKRIENKNLAWKCVATNGFPFEIKRQIESNPYAPMTEAEMLAKLEKSREQGMFRDADLVVSDMRLKYGL